MPQLLLNFPEANRSCLASDLGTLLTDQDLVVLDQDTGCMRVSFNCMGPTDTTGAHCLSPGLVYALKQET